MYPPECTDGLWGDELSEGLQKKIRTFILNRLGAGNLRVYGMIRSNRGILIANACRTRRMIEPCHT